MDYIKFENVSDDISYAIGTSLRGYINEVTTNQLISMFGEPNRVPSGDGKVQLEWIIKTKVIEEDGNETDSCFTLYDWKGSAPSDDNVEWKINVGGRSQQDYWNVFDAFDIANETDFLYAYDGDGKLCQAKEGFNLHLLEMCKKEAANG